MTVDSIRREWCVQYILVVKREENFFSIYANSVLVRWGIRVLDENEDLLVVVRCSIGVLVSQLWTSFQAKMNGQGVQYGSCPAVVIMLRN